MHRPTRRRTSSRNAPHLMVLSALLPGLAGLLPGGLLAGSGIGAVTPLGFAASAPPGRFGLTMGAAEVGREVGDAGGPLLVAATASAAALPAGLLTLAGLLVAVGAAIRIPARAAHRSRPE